MIESKGAEIKVQRSLFLLGLLCLMCCNATAQPSISYSYGEKTRTFHTREEFARLTKGSVKLYREASPQNKKALSEMRLRHLLPLNEATVIAGDLTSLKTELIWLGTKRGMYCYFLPGHRVSYFGGQRWLPDDEVLGIGFEAQGIVIWVETPKGFSRIAYEDRTSLLKKSQYFVERIRARHVRHGLTASSHLRVPGDLTSNQMVSSDNDGLWTAMYVAAECFRYKVTGDADARQYARQGMQAIMRLEEITGIPGFPARSFIKIGENVQPQDGEWHTTPDGQWRWKGDTSSDEIVGHYFVYPIYYDLVADETEKQKIRAAITRITDHILNNNYQLIDTDGKRTRWGWWGPDAIWEDPDETGLRALHLLSHLRVAHHITGNQRYLDAYDELINKHRYHLLMRNQKINYPGHVNHSDDELAFLSYYPLLQYETDPKLREVYIQSLDRSWQVERPERNPLWNFIYAAGSGKKDFDREEALRTLREIPMDLITWTVTNSHRPDVPMDALADRFGRKQALIVLPYDELPVMKWNGNPYRLDGGNGGRSEDDGAFFLLPYWMGRYHRLIDE
jgi:hypothetical protein